MKSEVFQRIIAKTPREVEVFIDYATQLALKVSDIIEKKGGQTFIKTHCDKYPQGELSKWQNGTFEFSLRALAKLSSELDENLLNFSK